MRILLLTVFALLTAGETPAQEQPVRMSLEQCIDRALMVSPDMEQAALAVRQLEARLSEAKFASILPQFTWTNGFGPSPGVKGNPDSLASIRNDLSDMSVFSRTQIDLVQPVYTFGKLGGAKEAARNGVAAGQAGVDKKRADVVLQTKRLFYALMLARSLREVVLEGRDKVGKARDRVDLLLEEGSDNVSSSDVLKIDVFEYEVLKNLARAEKSIEMGKSALKNVMKLDPATDVDIAVPEEAEPVSVELENLQAYVNRAKATRPDVRQLRAGLQARRSLLKVTRSDFYPQIAFIGSLQWGVAPNRPQFKNPFLRDEFNFFRAGGVITLRQQFSFGLTHAKYQAQKAELEDLMSKENQAMNAIALEVEQAYRDVVEADGNVRNSDRAMRSAKSWLTSAAIGFDITGDSSDLLNAFTAYSRMRQEYHQSIFNLNIAQSVLDHVTGVTAQSGRVN